MMDLFIDGQVGVPLPFGKSSIMLKIHSIRQSCIVSDRIVRYISRCVSDVHTFYATNRSIINAEYDRQQEWERILKHFWRFEITNNE